MAVHLQKEIDNLKKKILRLSAMVEENVERAVRAVEKRDADLAEKVVDMDRAVDIMEIEVEEECLKVLALHQPVATDLRFIVAVLKINSDLERIGDLTVNIAERSQELARRPEFAFTSNFPAMMEKARLMLKKVLDSLVNLDAKLALSVCAADDEVDALYREMFDKVKAGIVKEPDKVDDYLQMLSITRHLERIADHATNIAEDVIYMIEGSIIRHGAEKFRREAR
ncbi:MAG TPA: phosphate signaling complex protein PhoU [Chitinivibrionales bacterium]|nr:phosphate signaling complex protein PhoU [Chitinivibrionales bacterium]